MGPLTELALPPELLAGWALWLAGGLVLMLWFRRRSAPAPPPVVTVRQPPVRMAPTRPPAPKPPAEDPFAELHALLDEPK